MKNELNFNSDKKVRKLPRKKNTDSPEFYTYYENDEDDADIANQFAKECSGKFYSSDSEWN